MSGLGTLKDMSGRERWLTVDEVAAMFRVTKKTVRGWARAGKLAAIRTPGGNYLFPASEINRQTRNLWNAVKGTAAPLPDTSDGPKGTHQEDT